MKMMDRRDLLKKTSLAALAMGFTPFVGCSKSTQLQSVAHSTNSGGTGHDLPVDKVAPLPVPADGMLPAAFVLGKYAEVLDFCGPLEVFAGATTKEGKQLFAPFMVAATKAPVTVGGGMKVLPDYAFKDAPQPKVIVIPAMDFSGEPQEMFDWIRTASKATDVTMSVCNGAFVLAKTGLLSGKSATAHHGGFFRFAALYPDVHLRRGARYVEEGNLASAGGISSGIDLAVRVVERYTGKAAALDLVDAMEYQGKGWENPNSNETYAKMPAFTEEHPRCPVCQSDGDRSIKTSYNGKTYYFCARNEKEFFEKHSDVFDRFLAEDATLKPVSTD